MFNTPIIPWIVTTVAKDMDTNSFDFSFNESIVYPSAQAAIAAARRIYNHILNEFDLTDNNACNENDESTAGGCWTMSDENGGEAVIYDYMDCENGCLSERVCIIVTQLRPATK